MFVFSGSNDSIIDKISILQITKYAYYFMAHNVRDIDVTFLIFENVQNI